ncbi:hypothetical protein JTB14_031570 [Gonioctena quinquepunctata]|nr:hypothetical protein JTB14_031570 [Gonioctena quinquepunctata]
MIKYSLMIFTISVGLCSSTNLTTLGESCTITDYSQVSSVVNSCTNIVVSSIFVPAGKTLELNLRQGTSLTFDGIVKFGFSNWDGPLVQVQGSGITVKGTLGSKIDGEGAKYWDGIGGQGPRKPVLFAMNVNGGNFENIHLLNCPERCAAVLGSDLHLNYWNIDVSAGEKDNLGHNTDGFDVVGNGIEIKNSVVKNQDDCVVVNGGTNMHFRNIRCYGGHGLSLAVGMDKTSNIVRNITFTQCTLINSGGGIHVKTIKDGGPGVLEDVTYSHITLEGIVEYGIRVHQDYPYNDQKPVGNVPIRRLTIRDVKGTMNGSFSRSLSVTCASGACSDWSWSDISITDGVEQNCIINVFDDVPTVVGSCTDILLKGINVPAGKTLRLNLLPGTSLNIEGITTFGVASWDGPLMRIDGSGLKVTAALGSKFDGQGLKYWDGKGGEGKPVFLRINAVEGSEFHGIHLLNCPNVVPLFMERISNSTAGILTVLLEMRWKGLNTDGFDVSGHNIEIKNSVIRNMDDCVVVNRGTDMHFRNIYCRGRGLSIATGMDKTNYESNLVRNITFTQCTIINSTNGIDVRTMKDGGPGLIQDVTYTHITMIGCNSPITDTIEVTPEIIPTSSKRNVSEILTPTSEDTPKFTVPRNISITKKPKQDITYTIKPELMQDIEYPISQEQTPLIINAEQLKDLIENTHGSKDALSLSKDYIEDTPGLIELLTKIHSQIDNRSLEFRCTKLRKKLQKQLESETYEPQSDSPNQLY